MRRNSTGFCSHSANWFCKVSANAALLVPTMSVIDHCRACPTCTELPSTVFSEELKANDVTPPPPGVRPSASVPVGDPTTPVMNAVACTGASDCTDVPDSVSSSAVLQIRNGRCVRLVSSASANRLAVVPDSDGFGPVTCLLNVALS